MSKSNIEYCDWVVNPFVGCPGACEAHCWACGVVKRMLAAGQDWVRPAITDDGKWTGKLAFNWDCKLPPKTMPLTVFFGSLGDLGAMSKRMSDDEKLKTAMIVKSLLDNPHKVLLLTRYPLELMRSFMPVLDQVCGGIPARRLYIGASAGTERHAEMHAMSLRWLKPAYPNIRTWLSLEPMLGPMELTESLDYCQIDQVVVGCESGSDRRGFDWDWARQMRDQCSDTDTMFYLKQAPDTETGKILHLPELDGVRHDDLIWTSETF